MSERGIRVDSRAVEKALDELAGDVLKMPETHAAVASRVLPDVRARTPVRSGALRDSWTASGEADRGTISSDLRYAGVIESTDHPVADALAGSEREIVDAYEEELAKAARGLGFEVRR